MLGAIHGCQSLRGIAGVPPPGLPPRSLRKGVSFCLVNSSSPLGRSLFERHLHITPKTLEVGGFVLTLVLISPPINTSKNEAESVCPSSNYAPGGNRTHI